MIVDSHGNAILKDNIELGDELQIIHDDVVSASLPSTAHANKIIVLSERK